MVATTMFGFEHLLEKELKTIGVKKIKPGNRCVYFTGNTELMYKANIQLRTALKILKTLITFKAKKETELYKHISKIRNSGAIFIEFSPNDIFSLIRETGI